MRKVVQFVLKLVRYRVLGQDFCGAGLRPGQDRREAGVLLPLRV